MDSDRGGRRITRLRPRVAAALLAALGALAVFAGSASASVTGVAGTTFSAVAATPFSGSVASFTATSASTFDITVDWGDGSAATATTIGPTKAGTYAVPGTHTYAHEGNYAVTVTVTDEGDKSTAVTKPTSTAQVADAPLVAIGAPVTAAAGSTFSGAVASFTDPDTSGGLASYSASIDWGDGTSTPGSVTMGSGGFTVQGAHAYASAGPYTVSTTVHDSGGAVAAAATTAVVTAAASAPTGPGGSSPPGAPTFVATTTAPVTGRHVTFDATTLDGAHGGAVDHRWDLNGDGILERDTGRTSAVAVSYGQPGTYAVALQVAYRDGTTSTFHSTVTVSGAPIAGCGVYCHTDFPFHTAPSGGAGCQSTLHFGVVDAVGDCLRRMTDGTYEADGALRVNGLDFYPDSFTSHVILDPAHNSISSGGGTVRLQAGDVTLGDEPVAWTGLDGGGTNRATVPNVLGAGSLEGFPLVGTTSLTLTYVRDSSPGGPGDHGITTIGAYVMLPDFLGGVSAQVGVGIDNRGGLSLDQLHVSLDNARLKFLPIKMLSVDYDQSGGRWGGSLEVPTGSISIGASIGLRAVDPSNPNGDLTLDHLSVTIDDLNQSITAGVFLQAITAGFTLGPPRDIFTGGVTFTEGPKVSDIDLIQLVGTFTVTTGTPIDFNLALEFDVLSFKVGTAMADFRTDGHFSFAAHLRVPYWDDPAPPPPLRIQADVNGFIDGPSQTWLAEGHAAACLGVCVGVDAIASNIGLAGCIDLGFGDVGGAYTFSARRIDLFGGFGGSCDLSPWRPVSGAARASDLARRVTLAPGTHLAAFEVLGAGAPPLVRFAGPHSLVFTTPADAGGLKLAHAWLAKNPASNATDLAVSGDIAGTWTITPLAGSVPVRAATSALARPPVAVHARVGGRGRARSLAYTVALQPGQTVSFSEDGPGASAVIGKARGAHGTLRFAPADGPAGRRTIFALVSENGMPRRRLAVATYAAPRPLRPARAASLLVRRVAGGAIVTWGVPAGAATVQVQLTTVNHRLQVFDLPASTRRLGLAGIRTLDAATVTVTGLDRLGRPGPAASEVLRAGAAQAPAAKRHRRGRSPRKHP